jgi:hypothetical protein
VRRQHVALKVSLLEVVVGAVLAAVRPVAQVSLGVFLQSIKTNLGFLLRTKDLSVSSILKIDLLSLVKKLSYFHMFTFMC